MSILFSCTEHPKFCGPFFRLKSILLLLILMSMLLFAGIGPPPLNAQEEDPVSAEAAPPPVPAEAILENTEFEHINRTLEMTIATEKESIAKLTAELSRIEQWEKTIASDINAFNMKLSSYGNLLISPDAQAGDIEKAWAGHKAALDRMTVQLEESRAASAAISQMLAQANEQYDLNQKRLQEINTESESAVETQKMVERLQDSLRIISQKITLLESIDGIYSKHTKSLQETREAFVSIAPRFEQQIQIRKKEALFQRKSSPLLLPKWMELKSAFGLLLRQTKALFTQTFWENELRAIWGVSLYTLISVGILLIALFILLLRLHSFFRSLPERHDLEKQYPWRFFALKLIQGSLLLLGPMLFLLFYALVRNLYTTVPLIRTIIFLLGAWLFTRWGVQLPGLIRRIFEKEFPAELVQPIKICLYAIRIFAFLYLTLDWLLGSGGLILFLVRALFEIFLGTWIIFYRKPIQNHFRPALLWLGDIIVWGGILLEIAGYGILALYWYTSWGWTGVVSLWGLLLFKILKEWDKNLKSASQAPGEGQSKPVDPIRWLLIRIGWIVWAGLFVMAILFAWGASQGLVKDFFAFLDRPIGIGDLELRLTGLLYALLILLFIHALILLWRFTFVDRMLAHSGFDPGLKNSITVIISYLLWGLGILLALNAIGLSTTSLAVAFGAIGIGLGFGLQNIFSNFVSGIILLFERPIQVGDAVEINGVWGEVKKINVRATVVQTYDNASLIIPNSDFISSQVTNWSFKDLRVRRIIKVGVAYGSDTELVRDTLLEALDVHPKVLRYPRPYVLFTDFGDSSLDFQLRFWTDIDNFIMVETALRFEIDRLFRQKGIQIPFPQRDIHHHYPEKPAQPVDKEENGPADPGENQQEDLEEK